MKYRFRTFFAVSVVLHVAVVFLLVGVDFSRGRQVPGVYEVSIVATVPGTPGLGAAPGKGAVSGTRSGTRYIRKEGRSTKKIGGISREKGKKLNGLSKIATERIAPPELETEPYERRPGAPSDLASGRPSPEKPGTPGGKPGGKPSGGDKVAVWVGMVKEVVLHHWKTPPEMSVLDSSLKTTYYLRISRDGKILEKNLVVSSGNRPFDRSVLLALNAVGSLPRPPLTIMAGKSSEVFSISFSPPQGVR